MKTLSQFTVLVVFMLGLTDLLSQVTLPYTQNFDAFPVDNITFGPGVEPNAFPQSWNNVLADPALQDWYGRSTATGSSNTGPSADHTSGTGTYVFVEDGYGNYTDIQLETPQVDLTTVSSAAFIYWAHSRTLSATGNQMQLDVFHNGSWVLNIDSFSILSTTDTWFERTVDISAYTGSLVTFRFRGENNVTSFTHDIAIDDVSIIETVLTAQILNSDTSIECYGDSTGYAVASAVYGTPPYTYIWSTGDTIDSIGNLGAGTYHVDVIDNNGDSSSAEITISQNPNLTNHSSLTQLTCFGDANGEVVIDSTTGGTPFIPECGVDTNVQCSGPSASDTVGIGTNVNTNTSYPAPFGNWYWGAKHQIVYTKHDLNQLGIVGASLISALGFDVDTLTGGATVNYNNWTLRMGCTNDSLLMATGYGSNLETVLDPVNITIAQGWNMFSFDYPFVWDGESNIVLETCFNNTSFTRNAEMNRTNLGYTCVRYYRADNSLVCSNTASTGTSTIRPNTIFGSCPISTEPYQYDWSTNDTIDSIGGLVAGDYFLTVTDGLLCEFVRTFTITQPDSMYLTMVLDSNVSCYGLSDGSAVAQITGGTPTYTYNWSNAATTDTLSGVTVGTYTVTIDDSENCGPIIDSITIDEPDSLIATATMDTAVSCFGSSDGMASVSVTGGNGGNTFLWSNAGATMSIDNLTLGTYSVTVTDSLGCSDTSSTAVTQPDSLIATAHTVSNVSCNGFIDGVTIVFVQGGNGGYDYSWSNGGDSNIVGGLIANTYTVTITDSLGCSDISSTVVTEPDSLISTVMVPTEISCFGADDGVANVITTGGTLPYVILWSTNDSTTTTADLGPGVYHVTVTDSNNCVAVDSVELNEPDLLEVSGVVTNEICDGDEGGAIDITVTGGTTPYDFDWSNTATTEDLANIGSGNYSVTVTDFNGCDSISSYTVTFDNALPVVDLGADTTICDTASIFLDAGVHDTYVWSDATTGSTLSVSTSGSYSVTVTNAAGCSSADSISIQTNDCVGFAEVSSKSVIRFFPNPTNGQIMVDFNSKEVKVIGFELLDISGAIIEAQTRPIQNGSLLDFSSLAAGSYFLKFNTHQGPQVGILTIQ